MANWGRNILDMLFLFLSNVTSLLAKGWGAVGFHRTTADDSKHPTEMHFLLTPRGKPPGIGCEG